MAIDIEITQGEYLKQRLAALSPQKMNQAIKSASKRAATAARTAGTKQIRSLYTIKSGDMKARTSIKSDDTGSVITIKGSPEPVSKYQAKVVSSGIFVSVKRGGGAVVDRSFLLQGTKYVARVGKEHLPLTRLFGPAVPQLFGNAEVMQQMGDRGMEMFEQRLEHEIDRLEGGA